MTGIRNTTIAYLIKSICNRFIENADISNYHVALKDYEIPNDQSLSILREGDVIFILHKAPRVGISAASQNLASTYLDSNEVESCKKNSSHD
ncbi:hypothetical protein MXB_949, partial [Myxobolus squamalis]